jgi:uncharacterized protein (TIGR02246 family)
MQAKLPDKEVRMRRPWKVAPIAVLFLITGCQSSRVDLSRETENLLATDRAWAQLASAGQNADSILSFWTDDARVVMPGEPTYEGKDAIRQMVMRSLATPGFHVTWTTEKAVVSRSGDLGYTYGTNEFTMADSTGKATTIKARGITVWRKEPDGRWRCVADYSTQDPLR